MFTEVLPILIGFASNMTMFCLVRSRMSQKVYPQSVRAATANHVQLHDRLSVVLGPYNHLLSIHGRHPESQRCMAGVIRSVFKSQFVLNGVLQFLDLRYV